MAMTAVVLCLVLGLSGAKRLGQMVPESEEPGVRHLQDAADIARFVAIEKELRVGRIAVVVLCPVQKSQRHQRIQEVACAAGMQPEPSDQLMKLCRTAGEFGEDAHLDGA